MEWVEKFLDKLGEVIEMQSPGTISWRFIEIENWLLVAPRPLELVGGPDDGESVFPFFWLHISQLTEIFDEPPEVFWETMNHELSLEGTIDGDDAWITFSRDPFDDDEPDHVLDPKGGVKKKKPPAE